MNYGRKLIKWEIMSKSALLAKLKGKTRTFVVHSNTSPYAAAAAMGAAMGRSQALGPYFHLSAKRISGVQAEPATGAIGELAPSNLRVDFIGDWVEFLRQKGMAVCGLKYDHSRTLEENTIRYLNAHNRRIPPDKVRGCDRHEADQGRDHRSHRGKGGSFQAQKRQIWILRVWTRRSP